MNSTTTTPTTKIACYSPRLTTASTSPGVLQDPSDDQDGDDDDNNNNNHEPSSSLHRITLAVPIPIRTPTTVEIDPALASFRLAAGIDPISSSPPARTHPPSPSPSFHLSPPIPDDARAHIPSHSPKLAGRTPTSPSSAPPAPSRSSSTSTAAALHASLLSSSPASLKSVHSFPALAPYRSAPEPGASHHCPSHECAQPHRFGSSSRGGGERGREGWGTDVAGAGEAMESRTKSDGIEGDFGRSDGHRRTKSGSDAAGAGAAPMSLSTADRTAVRHVPDVPEGGDDRTGDPPAAPRDPTFSLSAQRRSSASSRSVSSLSLDGGNGAAWRPPSFSSSVQRSPVRPFSTASAPASRPPSPPPHHSDRTRPRPTHAAASPSQAFSLLRREGRARSGRAAVSSSSSFEAPARRSTVATGSLETPPGVSLSLARSVSQPDRATPPSPTLPDYAAPLTAREPPFPDPDGGVIAFPFLHPLHDSLVSRPGPIPGPSVLPSTAAIPPDTAHGRRRLSASPELSRGHDGEEVESEWNYYEEPGTEEEPLPTSLRRRPQSPSNVLLRAFQYHVTPHRSSAPLSPYIHLLLFLLRLLAVVPGLIGTFWLLHNAVKGVGGEGERRPGRAEFAVASVWAMATAHWCFSMTTLLLRRWLYHYWLLPSLIRLLSLQAICWPLTRLTLLVFGPNAPLASWVLIATTSLVSENVARWVTSNLDQGAHEGTGVRFWRALVGLPPAGGFDESLSAQEAWAKAGGWDSEDEGGVRSDAAAASSSEPGGETGGALGLYASANGDTDTDADATATATATSTSVRFRNHFSTSPSHPLSRTQSYRQPRHTAASRRRGSYHERRATEPFSRPRPQHQYLSDRQQREPSREARAAAASASASALAPAPSPRRHHGGRRRHLPWPEVVRRSLVPISVLTYASFWVVLIVQTLERGGGWLGEVVERRRSSTSA